MIVCKQYNDIKIYRIFGPTETSLDQNVTFQKQLFHYFDFSASTVSNNDNKIRLIIGNETSCSHDSISSIPCNGKLKANWNYS
jgi:hypothetical protein